MWISFEWVEVRANGEGSHAGRVVKRRWPVPSRRVVYEEGGRGELSMGAADPISCVGLQRLQLGISSWRNWVGERSKYALRSLTFRLGMNLYYTSTK